jgi:hypothetical protein
LVQSDCRLGTRSYERRSKPCVGKRHHRIGSFEVRSRELWCRAKRPGVSACLRRCQPAPTYEREFDSSGEAGGAGAVSVAIGVAYHLSKRRLSIMFVVRAVGRDHL